MTDNHELSILIPARSEMFLKNTVEDLLENIEADTEIIITLDSQWADPPIAQNGRVNIIYVPESVGQRTATNLACKLSKSKFVMKVDAHCSFDKGFDRKMIEAFEETGDNVTMVPIMRNLWVFDWRCYENFCGWKQYQGPTPEKCPKCGSSRKIRRDIKWIGKNNPRSTSYCFDAEPHFQYNEPYKHTKEYGIGTIVGYRLLIDFSPLSSDPLTQIMTLPHLGNKPSTLTGIINLLADFTCSHQFTVLPNSSRLWQNMASNTMGFSPIDNGRGFGVQEISFIRNKLEMERIAALPILTDVVNYGYILASSTGDGTNKPSVGETVCQGFLSEFSTPTITPRINSSLPNPTTRRILNSDTLNKFNRILGGEFVYSEIRKCFHNGSVALIPIHDKGLTESMSLQGSCFMLTREKYWELDICGEEFGSWGNQGIETACKTWLSGGRVLCNHRTWYAHCFRTQGGDFSFPYPVSGRETQKTKNAVWEQIKNMRCKRQVYPVSWLIEKFKPVPGWTEEKIKELKGFESTLNKGHWPS